MTRLIQPSSSRVFDLKTNARDGRSFVFTAPPQTRQLSTLWATFKDSKIVVVFCSCCGEDFSMVYGTAVGQK